MIASSLRALQEEGNVVAKCPACRSGNVQVVLAPSGSTSPICRCADCESQFFGIVGGEEVESFGTQASIYWQGQVAWLTKLLGYEPQSVLDIGCGKGEFLEYWPAGMEKVGIEPDSAKQFVAAAKGIKMFDPAAGQRFDVVTCYDVLNRSPFSARIFAHFGSTVHVGGIAAIQIPTFETHRAYLREEKARVWTLCRDGRRTTYFSRKYLQAKMEKAGFTRLAESWNSGLLPEGQSTVFQTHPLFDRYCAVFRKA